MVSPLLPFSFSYVRTSMDFILNYDYKIVFTFLLSWCGKISKAAEGAERV